MRVTKKYNVRLNEILDAAEMLFAQTGYEKTTINSILEKVGIGKGTFYHYFQSKEELADAVVARVAEYMTARVNTSQSRPAENAHDKMLAALYALSLRIAENPHLDLIDAMGNPYNAFLHQKVTVNVVRLLAPILAAIAEEGIAEGFYQSEYPLETFEISISAILTLHNWNIMGKSLDELELRMTAITRMMELSLGAPKGSFDILLGKMPTEKGEES